MTQLTKAELGKLSLADLAAIVEATKSRNALMRRLGRDGLADALYDLGVVANTIFGNKLDEMAGEP